MPEVRGEDPLAIAGTVASAGKGMEACGSVARNRLR